MAAHTDPPGRRDRAKREKLERITAAAAELFATRGVDEVTTQQIADRADVGAGTVFLYARTKAELLLLVQNDLYRDALEQGRQNAPAAADPVSAVMGVLAPVIVCNRKQVDNGRTYLREILFGDPAEPNHRDAIHVTAETGALVASELHRRGVSNTEGCEVLASSISGLLYLTLADERNRAASTDELIAVVQASVGALLSVTR